MNKATVNLPKRPALRYYGAKWRLAPWIMSFFPGPEHHDVYVEPYGGSAAVLLQKPRSRIEVYNDLDKEILTFFHALRDFSADLITAIQLTPYHKIEYDKACESTTLTLPVVEQARRFYIRSFMSIMGPTLFRTSGFRRQKQFSRGKSGRSSMKPSSHSFHDASYLYVVAQRLQGVTFECMDALELFKLYDHPRTLFYLDPPYLGSTRVHQGSVYQHEMMDESSHESSIFLFSNALGIPLISGYNSDLYKDLLETKGWKLVEKESRTNGANSKTECLWLSPRLLEIIGDKNV